MRTFTCGDQQYGRKLKLRTLVTNDWVYVPPGLVSGGRGVGDPLKLHLLFLGLLLGGSNSEKMPLPSKEEII